MLASLTLAVLVSVSALDGPANIAALLNESLGMGPIDSYSGQTNASNFIADDESIKDSSVQRPGKIASISTLLRQSEEMGLRGDIPSTLTTANDAIEHVFGANTDFYSSRAQQKAQLQVRTNQNASDLSGIGHRVKFNPWSKNRMLTMIASGLVEAFMHKQHLHLGEERCLEDSVSQVAGDLVDTAQDVFNAFRALTNVTAGKNGATPTDSVPIVDAALRLTRMVYSVAGLFRDCVQADVLHKLNEAARHLNDMKYLGDRLVVNGVDIAKSLADSIISYEDHNYHRCGKDIGAALREVFLSKSTSGSLVPEGVPEKTVIQQTCQGLLDGFFVGGASMEITDSARPDVDVHLDLHRCIADNEPLFNHIYSSIWNAIALFSSHGEQHGLHDSSSLAVSPHWTDELMLALMQLPSALKRCNIDAESQQMLMESIRTLDHVRTRIELPSTVSMDDISKRFAKAVNFWTEWDYKRFGHELGAMLRETVLMLYPMKYSIDHIGSLRRQWSWTRLSGRGIVLGFIASSLLAVFLVVSIGVVVVRKISSMSHVSMPEVDAKMVHGNMIEEGLE